MLLVKRGEPRHEEADRKRGGTADGEHLVAWPGDARDRVCEGRERIARRLGELARFGCERHAAPFPLDQLHTELALQGMQTVTDCALREVQLRRRARHAAEPRDR